LENAISAKVIGMNVKFGKTYCEGHDAVNCTQEYDYKYFEGDVLIFFCMEAKM